MSLLYNFFIQLYISGMKLVALFNPKAKKAINGRVNWEENLKKKIDKNDSWIWMHCSSLGEFEQGRPVFEALKQQFPDHKLALSFFSPSGYEIRKDYDLADVVFYIPFDTPGNAKKLSNILQPDFWILVKYDYWYNHLKRQRAIGTKIFVISAIFRENQIYFKPYGRWMINSLKDSLSYFFVQDENSKLLLENKGVQKVKVAGDTRYDRVKSIAVSLEKLTWVEEFKAHKKLIVVGSSWENDEQLWLEFIQKHQLNEWKIIIVPHEISPVNIQKLMEKLKGKSLKFSDIKPAINLANYDILIVDTIGFLSKIYASAELAYVGGGFSTSGVHNTLEPAVFGIPVIIGPNFQKFEEVKLLIANDVVYPVNAYKHFEKTLISLTQNQVKRKEIKDKATEVFAKQLPSTEIIINYLKTEQ